MVYSYSITYCISSSLVRLQGPPMAKRLAPAARAPSGVDVVIWKFGDLLWKSYGKSAFFMRQLWTIIILNMVYYGLICFTNV